MLQSIRITIYSQPIFIHQVCLLVAEAKDWNVSWSVRWQCRWSERQFEGGGVTHRQLSQSGPTGPTAWHTGGQLLGGKLTLPGPAGACSQHLTAVFTHGHRAAALSKKKTATDGDGTATHSKAIGAFRVKK